MFVFVYGTLKRNEPNHNWLSTPSNGMARFVSEGKLLNKYPLVIASKYNIPFLLDAPGVGSEISGEVFEIDDEMLKNLDMLEEYPKLYTRRQEPVTVQLHGSNEPWTLKAWTYVLLKYRPDMLTLPYLTSYSSSGPHNLPYIARYLRENQDVVPNMVHESSYSLTNEDDLNDANNI